MKPKARLFNLLVLFLVLSRGAIAGDGSGQVEIEHVGNFGSYGPLVFFYTTSHNNRPACNTYRERWVLSLDGVAGKEMYSFLLAAQVANKDVVVAGAATCGIFSGSEDVTWIGFPVTHP